MTFTINSSSHWIIRRSKITSSYYKGHTKMARGQHLAMVLSTYKRTWWLKVQMEHASPGPELFKSLEAPWTEVMLVVSKQRVMRHKLNTDVNMIFSEMSWFIHHLQGTKISFIYTHDLYFNTAFSYQTPFVSTGFMVVVCTCSFLRRNVQSLIFFPTTGLCFKMQTGQQVAITVAGSCEMMLVPVRSVLFIGFHYVCLNVQ